MKYINIPGLGIEVGLSGSCVLQETAGPGCIALGVMLGVYVNQQIR